MRIHSASTRCIKKQVETWFPVALEFFLKRVLRGWLVAIRARSLFHGSCLSLGDLRILCCKQLDCRSALCLFPLLPQVPIRWWAWTRNAILLTEILKVFPFLFLPLLLGQMFHVIVTTSYLDLLTCPVTGQWILCGKLFMLFSSLCDFC